jgi:hypothetical protein
VGSGERGMVVRSRVRGIVPKRPAYKVHREREREKRGKREREKKRKRERHILFITKSHTSDNINDDDDKG